MADHQRAADLEHFRGGRAVAQDLDEQGRVEPALGAEHQRLGERRGVEPHQEIRRELGERGHAGRAHVDRPARDRREGRPAGLEVTPVAPHEDHAVAARHHRARSAHRGVEEGARLRRRGVGEAPRQRGRDRAHLDQRRGRRRRVEEPAGTQKRRVHGVGRRQDREDRVGVGRGVREARGGDEPPRAERYQLAGQRVVARHLEAALEEARGHRGAEEPDADDPDAFHRVSLTARDTVT